MTRFTEKATAITPNRELQSDEYFNETDHLIYCSKCNTPRQCRHELQGKVLIPSIRCKCQQEIFEQEEAHQLLSLLFVFVCPYRLQFFLESITTGGNALAQSDLLSDNFQPPRNIGKLCLDCFLFFAACSAGFRVKLLSLLKQGRHLRFQRAFI